jgi:hypothetical protein
VYPTGQIHSESKLKKMRGKEGNKREKRVGKSGGKSGEKV